MSEHMKQTFFSPASEMQSEISLILQVSLAILSLGELNTFVETIKTGK